VLSLTNFAGVLELSSLGIKSLLYVVVVAVVDLLVLDSSEVVRMLLWKNLLVLDWLDGSVVVILVDLTINSSSGLLMSGLGNVLVGNSWVDSLVDGGVMLSILGEESGNCLLCLIHCEGIFEVLDF